jgi:hypothetical protein
MDCRTARLLLDYARPHRTELPAEEAAPLEAHLAGCPDCDTLARGERQADEALGKAMLDVSIPDGLRQGIFERLQTERLQRQRRRWAWGARAAAAVLLIAAAGWWWVRTHPSPLPQIDPDEVVAKRLASTNREQAEAFFRERGVPAVFPSDFNYGLLKDYYLRELPAPAKGPRVPWLQFRQGEYIADVYILSDKQFDVQNLPLGSLLADTGNWKLRLLDSERSDLHYLILYTGDWLERFLNEGPRQAT